MNKELILNRVKDFLYKRLNIQKEPKYQEELIVKPIITLSWGIVYGFNFKKREDFLVGNIPVLYDNTKNEIVPLRTIIKGRDGRKRRISYIIALEKYRKKYNLELLNKKQYEDIIIRSSLIDNNFDQDKFEELISAIKNYKVLIKKDSKLDRNTIARIFEFIRDMEYIKGRKDKQEEKKKLIEKSITTLKQLFEELLCENIERWDPMTDEIWYGVKKRK